MIIYLLLVTAQQQAIPVIFGFAKKYCQCPERNWYVFLGQYTVIVSDIGRVNPSVWSIFAIYIFYYLADIGHKGKSTNPETGEHLLSPRSTFGHNDKSGLNASHNGAVNLETKSTEESSSDGSYKSHLSANNRQ